MSILSPKVEFIKDEGNIKISGRSVEAKAEIFWSSLISEIEEYLKDPRDIIITFEFEYFNTRSAKYILKLLRSLKEKIEETNRKLVVKWIYSDSDIKEAGEDYEEMIQFGTWKHIKKERSE
jgi:hypothetical protein